jgi:hypothetical protein
MKQKFAGRVVALVLSFALALAVFTPVAVSAEPFVVYSMARDWNIQSLAMGTSGDGDAVLAGTAQLVQAGSPTFEIVPNPFGGNAIRVSGRTADWHTLDVLREGLDMNPSANRYTMRVTGSVASGTPTAIVGGPDSPWNWLGSAPADADGNFTMYANISASAFAGTDGGAEQFSRGFRIQTNNTVAFTIYEITIVRGADVPYVGEIAAPPAGGFADPTPPVQPDPTPAPSPDPIPTPTPTVTVAGSRLQFTLGSPGVLLDGVPFYTLDASPFLAGGRTMVPVRFITETLGGRVETDFTNVNNRMIFIYDSAGTLLSTLTIGQELPGGMGAPVLEGGRTFVPLRFVSEVLGAEVDHDFSDTANRRVFVYMS